MKTGIIIASFAIIAFSIGPLLAICQSSISNEWNWEDEITAMSRPDLLPRYRMGSIAGQVSSYDTTDGNDDGFSGRYSFLRREGDDLILAELTGPGVVNRIWTPTPTADTIALYFDGETTPRIALPFEDLFSGRIWPFVEPLSGSAVGGFYCYLPIPYERSLKIVFKGPNIMFHQIQYRSLPGAVVRSYEWAVPAEALAEISRVWNATAAVTLPTGEVVTTRTTLSAGEEVVIFSSRAPGRIQGFEINANGAFDGLHKDVILAARWDDDKVDAIHAPAADFFGYAYGRASMNSMLVGSADGVDYFRIPAPYDRRAEMRLIYKKRNGVDQRPIEIETRVWHNDNGRDPDTEGRLYTVWNRSTGLPVGQPYTFARISGRGHYVGHVHQAQGLIPGMTAFFEGDDVVTTDGEVRLHGTGSEDLYNGGWYAVPDRWDGPMSLPLHGSLDYSLPMARTGGYRFFMSDKLSFEHDLDFTIEHGPEGNAYPVDYTSVAWYYADRAPEGIVEPTDELRTVWMPTSHTFYPQLMNINPGRGLQLSLDDMVRTRVTEPMGGRVRILLSEVPAGHYRLYLTWLQKPDGADFRVWQRQNILTEWIPTYASQEVVCEKFLLGDITLTPQTASITIEVRSSQAGGTFDFGCLFLERTE